MQARNNLLISSPLIRRAIITSGMLSASGDTLANRLAALCEQFYLNRQVEQLTEAAELLVSLPGERARAAGLFYQAMCECIAGTDERAEPLLRAVIGMKCTPKFQARALQSLGIIHRYANDTGEAVELYGQAMRAGVECGDFIAIIRAGMTLAELHGSEGDHQRSLAHLRAIRPAVETVARVAPVYLPLWANDVAIDLAGLGRVEEARKFAAFAVASPYSRAYPEWLETAQEIEQAREPIAAQKPILRALTRPARSRGLRRSSRTLFLIQKLALKASRRRLQPRTAIFTRELPRSRPTLEQVSLKIRIRAPSF